MPEIIYEFDDGTPPIAEDVSFEDMPLLAVWAAARAGDEEARAWLDEQARIADEDEPST